MAIRLELDEESGEMVPTMAMQDATLPRETAESQEEEA
jgi:hypothetical protein